MDTKSRIIGIDLARAVALFGIILFDCKMFFHPEHGREALQFFSSLFDGQAAVLLSVLGGITYGLATQEDNFYIDDTKLLKVRKSILKRSVVIFILGMLLKMVWPAEILSVTAIYCVLGIVAIERSRSSILVLAVLSIVIFLLLAVLNVSYNLGWQNNDPFSFVYTNWTFKGMFRFLFYNGFYPIFPWFSFFLLGIWVSRFDIRDESERNKVLVFGGSLFFLGWNLSETLKRLLTDGTIPLDSKKITPFLELDFVPPGPLFILYASGIAIMVILFMVHWGQKIKNTKFLAPFCSVGQSFWTIYLLHLLVGLGCSHYLHGTGEWKFGSVVVYSLSVFGAGTVLAHLWTVFVRLPTPIEMIIKKI